jgi:general secretion pathway protein N
LKRGFWITLLAILLFAVIVIARLPASWVVPSSGANFSCAAVDGSIWSGSCTGLRVSGSAVGDAEWEVHALRLLAGKLAAHVTLTLPKGFARGDVEVGLDKNVTMHNVQAELPLDRSLMPAMSPTLHGNAHADIAFARIEKGVVKQLQGRIEVHDLEQRDGSTGRLGNYSVTFPAGSGEPTGQVRDLGGPLGVEGTLRLTPEPGYDLQGQVAARADASPGLQRDLQYLGSPDAQGRRPFGTSGTF